MSQHSHRFCVAPMMEWTDRHCRMLHRALSKNAFLYTEMEAAEAVIRGKREQILGFHDGEHPVALQLGGSEADRLALASKIVEEFGYDEVNLNAGCPSDKVQNGNFGAAMMKDPQLVTDCLGAMVEAVDIPVTLKCRIGVDDQDPEVSVRAMVKSCRDAGVKLMIIHARKAWLKGLSPKQNRTRPPLNYDLVWRIKAENPDLEIIINGGIETIADCKPHLEKLDGVMLGRAAYQTPDILADVDSELFGGPENTPEQAVLAYMPYIEAELASGVPLHAIARHMLGLFSGRPGSRAFRRTISESTPNKDAGIDVLKKALSEVRGFNAFNEDFSDED